MEVNTAIIEASVKPEAASASLFGESERWATEQ
jgi:hypothetical protein